MTTLPQEAVKAAADAAHEELMLMAKQMNVPMEYTQSISVNNYRVMRAALTAALPFLPVQGAVNIDEIVQPLEDIHAPGGLCRWTDVATAIGEVRRALSALEPSSARELALEEIIALCKDYAEDSQPDSEYRLACNDIIEAIQERRALSSPDHPDAGKVEGDGWIHKAAELYDRCKLFPETSAEGFTALLQLRNHVAEILPSAPASEGAE